MIRMIKGTYGLVKNGTVEPMTKHSPAFSINAAREAELVEAGVAVYEAEPESTFSEYNGLNMTELREAAAAYGVDASAVRSKKEVIALIEAAKANADSSAKSRRNLPRRKLVSFKDQIKQDLSDIFLNLDEFADLHRIEGKEVPVVIDSDIMAKLSKIGDNRIHGMDEADMIIMGKASDLPENLDPGRLLNLDGREVIVVTTTSEMGLVQIAVRQNRMS